MIEHILAVTTLSTMIYCVGNMVQMNRILSYFVGLN